MGTFQKPPQKKPVYQQKTTKKSYYKPSPKDFYKPPKSSKPVAPKPAPKPEHKVPVKPNVPEQRKPVYKPKPTKQTYDAPAPSYKAPAKSKSYAPPKPKSPKEKIILPNQNQSISH